ncbi:MAG: hypothetical protein R3195_05260 [Gemmatimonadota bacterium]|nr:hypothetical protein [Gemmatimonadota bacterium]
MKTLSAMTLLAVIVLTACRPDRERAAIAQVPDAGGIGAASPSSGALPEAGETSLRRLWAGDNFNFYASSPSPDGRWVTEIDWSTGDLAVRDLSTGRLHHLTAKGSWAESGDYAEVSRFSPDGSRIAYAWFNSDRVAESTSPSSAYEIRILDFVTGEDGTPSPSEPRVVVRSGPTRYYWLFGWSGRDELLVGIYRPDNTTALGMLSAKDGSLRVLRSFDWREPRAVLSPDGDWVAYDLESDDRVVDRDIYLLSTSGGSETRLVEGAGNDRVMGWMNDGSLLFHSDRSGVPAIWRLGVSNGAADGSPTPLREDVRNVQPLGLAGSSLYFGVVVNGPRFQTARIDVERGTLADLPVAFEAPTTGDIQALAWSPDGEYVVHDVDGRSTTRILMRSASGEVVRTSSFDFKMGAWGIHWTSNGRSVWLHAMDDQSRGGLYRIDLDTFEATAVRPVAARGNNFSFHLSHDGGRTYFTRPRVEDGRPVIGEAAVVEADLVSGRERVVRAVPGVGQVVPSPDGKWLAYFERATGREIRVFPLEGGEPIDLHVVESGRTWGPAVWMPDGRSLLFFERLESGGNTYELQRVSFPEGEVQRLGQIETTQPGLALHPDGRTIAYRTGLPRGEIWALDVTGGVAAAPRPEGSR